jgi:WD40 repeat protein
LFISHSSKNDDWAIALKDWLVREGWSSQDDIFLDLDPERGIVAGQRWAKALEDAATRCEAVLFVVSEEWLSSKWCGDEYQLACKYNKKLFALLIDDVEIGRLPGGLTAQWQVVHLKGEPAERFPTTQPFTGHQSPVHIAMAGLKSLKRGLDKAGIGADTFELQPDPAGTLGWRRPYRGLEALEPEDAAVFFGRDADIVRGIDALRGLASRKAPRLIVVLGSSGAGKSSFLRAGLWPRLNRDDSQWLPFRTIRAGHGGAIEGSEGLLAALEDVHRRFAIKSSRADLRERVVTPESFLELLRELRLAAATRALLSAPPYPLPVLCLDQGEELFAPDAGTEAEKCLRLVRAAIDGNEALLLVTIRTDSYGLMQGAKVLDGVEQVPISLGPMPSGEIARVIRKPAEILRRMAGPSAPVFDAAVVERLQAEVEGEEDALPLLAFVLERLVREYAGVTQIGLNELNRTGGVAEAVESEAAASLVDAGIATDRPAQRSALRSLFIPRLARIDRDTKAPQRRIARQSELPIELLTLARALTRRRLLVAKLARKTGDTEEAATIEVAHEALLRRWPTLVELLAEDRDALLLLDGVLSSAADWEKAEAAHKPDYLAHRASRLSDAQALSSRGPDWERPIAPARAYLAACQAREIAEHDEKEAALAREQVRLAEVAAAQEQMTAAQARTAHVQRNAKWTLAAMAVAVAIGLAVGLWQQHANGLLRASLENGRINLLAELATTEQLRGNLDGSLRFAALAARLDLAGAHPAAASRAPVALAVAVAGSGWRLALSGHELQLSTAFFNEDASQIVTASFDKTARIWNVRTGSTILVLSGHIAEVNCASFSPDGTLVATASFDKTARIWDARTGKAVAILEGHDQQVNSAIFSADGSRIVTASWDNTARIWDVTTGKAISILNSRETVLYFAGFSPDGSRIVTAAADQTAQIWDVATGKELAILKGHKKGVVSAAFSPDGSRLVTASWDGTARIWNASTGIETQIVQHSREVNYAAFSPDGTRIVTASWDHTARIWDVMTGQEIAVLRGHEGVVLGAAFSADGSEVVTSSEDRTARIWNVAGGRETAVLHHDGEVKSAAYSFDGSYAVTGSWDKTARVWNALTGTEVVTLRGHEAEVNSAKFSPEGSRIVTASGDRTARVWDAGSAKLTTELVGHKAEVNFVDFSPDGLSVVSASSDTTARIWDATTGQVINVLSGHQDPVNSAVFSRDGSKIVTSSLDNSARIWDAKSGKELTKLDGHEAEVKSAAFSTDGSLIVTASADLTARTWDAATGKTQSILRHAGVVNSAVFSPDGSRIVSVSDDRTVHVWDSATGKEIDILRGHHAEVVSVGFSPDESRIVTASFDKTARIWDIRFDVMPAKQLLFEVCSRRLGPLTALTLDEMRLAGRPEGEPAIDVCRPAE